MKYEDSLPLLVPPSNDSPINFNQIDYINLSKIDINKNQILLIIY